MPKSNKTTSQTASKPRTTTRKTQAVKIDKDQAEKYLAKVPEQQAFWCHDGRILNDMRDLRESLATMSDETFNYHSNDMKKDFSNWIRDVVGDEKLAKDLEKAKSRTTALKAVDQRCSLLQTSQAG